MKEGVFQSENRVYLFCFYIISFLPLISLYPWFYPPSWGKSILFKIIVLFLLFYFLYQLAFKRLSFLKEIKKLKVFWIIASLFILTLLSTLFSENPHFSFWGSPQRGGGSFTFILFLAFLVLAILTLRKDQWKKLWRFNFIVGSLVAVIALFQKMALFDVVLIPREYRTVSTLGGPHVLALYLSLLSIMVLPLAFKKRSYYLVFFLFLAGVFSTGTRATIIALTLSLLVFFSKKIISKKYILLLLIFLVILTPLLFKSTLERFSFLYKEPVMEDRLSAWKISFQGLKDHPLLGFGPENFSIPFEKYYDSSLPGLKDSLPWMDRAHNIVLDLSLTYGIPFFLLYFLLFLSLFKKQEIKAAFTVYFLANLFSFDVFSTYFLIFLIAAYAFHLKEGPFLKWEEKKEQSPVKTLAFSLLFIILSFFIYFSCLKPLSINQEINQAARMEPQEAVKKMDELLTQKSVIDSYVRINYAVIASYAVAETSLNESLTIMEKTIKALEEQVEIRPKYTKSWWLLNFYANNLAKYSGSEEMKEKALYYCQRAKELSPDHWLVLKECSQTYSLLKENL